MLVGIHQPHYLPWLRYVEKIARSDVFIVLDDVDYEKGGHQNRNRIKTAHGALQLTVPVRRSLQRPIPEIEIDVRSRWQEKHRTALEQSYRQASYWERYWPALAGIWEREWSHLAELNRAMLEALLPLFGITTPVVYSSTIPVRGQSTRRLAELCRAVGGDAYLSGANAVDTYLDDGVLREAGIRLVRQEWEAPVYRQLYPRAGFVPDLSVLDLLMNEGPRSLEILLAAGGATYLDEAPRSRIAAPGTG